MHRSESSQIATCVECGAEIAPSTERGFALTSDSFLCFACAVRRGGRYDERLDRWEEAPGVGDLAPGE